MVRGEDTNTFYTGVSWSFTVHDGRILNDTSTVTAGTSATFDNALDRFRDFYVHEPVVIYFGFDHDNITATELTEPVCISAMGYPEGVSCPDHSVPPFIHEPDYTCAWTGTACVPGPKPGAPP